MLRRLWPPRFAVSFDQLAALLALNLLVWAGLDALHADRHAELALDGLFGWTCYLLLALLAAGIIARAYSRAADTRALLVPALAVAPYVLAIFWLAGDLASVGRHPLTATVVAVVYLCLLVVRVLGAAFGPLHTAAALLAVLLVGTAPWTLDFLNLDTRLWIAADTQAQETEDPGAVEELLYDQPARIAAAVRADSKRPPAAPSHRVRRPTGSELGIGFLTDFLDTLGIGSFATTTALFKLLKLAPDEDIPGTLNVGHAIPTFLEAFIFIAIVAVEGRTLVLMIAASVVGAWLGAGYVASWSRRKIQIGMGIALMVAAAFFLMKIRGWFPEGGSALGLSGPLLAIGLIGNFIFGALMTLGIGAYAPSMILVSLLGMNPVAAFPIMMGSCAFLMPAASIHFIRQRRYAVAPSLGLTLGGAPAVLIAAYVVKSLPLTALRWLVMAVVLYTAVTMLRSAWVESVGPRP